MQCLCALNAELNYGNMKKRKTNGMTPKELANKLQPVILDLIYDSIDWQMDEEIKELENDDHNNFHNQVFKELLKQLQEL